MGVAWHILRGVVHGAQATLTHDSRAADRSRSLVEARLREALLELVQLALCFTVQHSEQAQHVRTPERGLQAAVQQLCWQPSQTSRARLHHGSTVSANGLVTGFRLACEILYGEKTAPGKPRDETSSRNATSASPITYAHRLSDVSRPQCVCFHQHTLLPNVGLMPALKRPAPAGYSSGEVGHLTPCCCVWCMSAMCSSINVPALLPRTACRTWA